MEKAELIPRAGQVWVNDQHQLCRSFLGIMKNSMLPGGTPHCFIAILGVYREIDAIIFSVMCGSRTRVNMHKLEREALILSHCSRSRTSDEPEWDQRREGMTQA